MSIKVLFIDRDGVLIKEPPQTFQVNSLEEMTLLPGLIRNLHKITRHLDYELVMVTNQDGLGTPSYPEENFNRVQGKLLELLENEGIRFAAVHVDRSFEHENLPTRKPDTGMLQAYLQGGHDLSASYVIGDRWSDIQLAKNLGARAIGLRGLFPFGEWEKEAAFIAESWDDIAGFLLTPPRVASVKRKTNETDVSIALNLDGSGKADISTGIGFFDHMLEQIARHGSLDLAIKVQGDLHIDEHHTVEGSPSPCPGAKTGHRALRLLPAYGRLPGPGGPGFWRPPLAGMAGRIPPRENRGPADRAVLSFFQIPERHGPLQPEHPGSGQQRAS